MIIALNNKSNLKKEEFSAYYEELRRINTDETIILCPTFINLGQINNSEILIGSQTVSSSDDGAFTGEISAKQLKSFGVSYSIVGHSERREYQKETNADINKKLKKLLSEDITPILCIGETKEERDNKTFFDVLKAELLEALDGIDDLQKNKIIVAYEPIWSIGTGVIPTNEEIKEVFTFIKEIMKNSKVLYGGSANNGNIDELKTIDLIDGFLLGGLSLKPNDLKIFLEKLKK